jgi:hypothetical protein
MRTRHFAILALIALAVPALPARAEEKTKEPTLVVRVPALDDLVADLRFLAEQAGRGEEAKQFEKLLKSMTGEKGLEGLDTKKPMGLYGTLGAQLTDSTLVAMVPIADEKQFMNVLGRLGVKPVAGKGGVYEVQPKGSPFPLYFRFAHGYAVASLQSADAISDAKLLKPATILGGAGNALEMRLNLAGFPKELRDTVIGQVELRMADLKEKMPGETEAQHKLRVSLLEETVALAKSVLTDGGKTDLRLELDRKASDIHLSVGVSAKPDSRLSKLIQSLGAAKSTVSGVISDGSVLSGRLTFALSESVKTKLSPVIDEGVKKMLESITDENARDLLKPVVDAVVPTLKAGLVDVATDMRGPSAKKHYTVVEAVAVKDGKNIEKAIRDLLAKLPAELTGDIKTDVDKVGAVNIHSIDLRKGIDEKSKAFLGDTVFYLALRDDALLIAGGEDALPALKAAIASKGKPGPIMQAQVSMARLAEVMALQQKAAPGAAAEAFGKQKGDDRMVLSLEAGKELRLRLSMKAAVVKFFAALDRLEKESPKP